MGARSFRELIAWQRADDLRRAVYRLTPTPPVSRDAAYRQQLESAIASVPANIAEGFKRFSHADFARFLRMAAASLAEADERLLDGVARGHFSEREYAELLVSLKRAGTAIARLRAYLQRTPTPR